VQHQAQRARAARSVRRGCPPLSRSPPQVAGLCRLSLFQTSARCWIPAHDIGLREVWLVAKGASYPQSLSFPGGSTPAGVVLGKFSHKPHPHPHSHLGLGLLVLAVFARLAVEKPPVSRLPYRFRAPTHCGPPLRGQRPANGLTPSYCPVPFRLITCSGPLRGPELF